MNSAGNEGENVLSNPALVLPGMERMNKKESNGKIIKLFVKTGPNEQGAEA